MGIKENKLDVIVENESKSFVKDYVGVEKILEDFNNKRFYQFCKVGSFASKLDKKEIARAKRDLRKSIQKKKPTISKSYLNDTFRVFTPKLHEKIIKKNSSVDMVKAQLEKAGITNYEEFKYFMHLVLLSLIFLAFLLALKIFKVLYLIFYHLNLCFN